MTSHVLLRAVTAEDLPIFFDHQLDRDANQMAAFRARDKEAFTDHWHKILADEKCITRAILYEGVVAGNIGSWEDAGQRNIGYWIGKAFWGKGIATAALLEFLNIVKTRPLYAHVAKHNLASLRVLEKCGFAISGEDKVSADAPSGEVEEFILKLEANECNTGP
jgi:RimJ/RimL family protein N-acetyltransferase